MKLIIVFKRLVLVSLLISLFPNYSFSYDEWNCQKINSEKSRCLNTVSGSEVEFIGKISNNKPDGFGIFKTINNKDKSFPDIYAEGLWETLDNAPVLIDGYKIFDEVKLFYENKNLTKVIYPDGSIFLGKKKDKGFGAELVGTLTHGNGNIFTGVIKSVFDPVPIKGKEETLSGPNKGDVFEGTFFINGEYHSPKKGKYIWAKKNNQKIDYFEGTFKFINDKSYMENGSIFFLNGDSYNGSFKDDNFYFNGTYFYKNGKKVKYISGKPKIMQSNKEIFEIIFLVVFIPLGSILILRFVYWPFFRDLVYIPFKENPSAFLSKAGIILFVLSIIAVSIGGNGDPGCAPRFFTEGPRC